MKNAYTQINVNQTPQNQPIPGKTQIKNKAGGYVFQTNDWMRLRRFLILGSAGGTYYASEKDHTLENFDLIERLVATDGKRVIENVVEVFEKDLAIKPDPALFTLAYVASKGSDEIRKDALHSATMLIRIPTQLFHFVQYATQFRGWGRGLRKAVAAWYEKADYETLIYHLMKYQSRDGWTNADMLRLAHPKLDADLAKWVLGKEVEIAHPRVGAFETLKKLTDEKEVIRLIMDYDLPRECVPTNWLNSKAVWEALLEKMPYIAMLRNLGKMTSVGLLDVYSESTKKVVAGLTNEDAISKSHVHPMAILIAHKTYAQGHGEKGHLNWNPVASITDATDEAFYLAMKNVQPTNKKLLVAVDESGSMTHEISGLPLHCFEAASAMAMIHVHAEPAVEVVAYDTQIRPVSISKRERLEQIIRKFNRGGGTDSSLPMAYAIGKKAQYDAIVEYTDNETWAGGVHVCQHMNNYRKQLNNKAKFIVGAMTATDSSLPDPDDNLSLEIVGFDASAPTVIHQFLTDQL